MFPKTDLYYIFILRSYLQSTFGFHLPYEIIYHIILSIPSDIKISCGYAHTIALTKDNKVYSWGNNTLAQLGLGHNNSVKEPTEINLPNVISVSCGADHTIALTKDNKLYSWGENDEGELGLGHNNNVNEPTEIKLPNVISVSCGYSHTLAITKDNKIYSWGVNK